MGQAVKVGSWVRMLEPHSSAALSVELLTTPAEGGEPVPVERGSNREQRLADEIIERVCGWQKKVPSGACLLGKQALSQYPRCRIKDAEDGAAWDGHAFVVKAVCPSCKCVRLEHTWEVFASQLEPVVDGGSEWEVNLEFRCPHEF